MDLLSIYHKYSPRLDSVHVLRVVPEVGREMDVYSVYLHACIEQDDCTQKRFKPLRIASPHLNRLNRFALRTGAGRWIGCIAVYRGTSLIRNQSPLGPYSRNMTLALSWSNGGVLFLMSEVPLYLYV